MIEKTINPLKILRILLIFQTVMTFAAGLVLIFAPELIPSTVGIKIEPSAYLICYLLAACELSLAALSIGSITLTDVKALRIIIITCLVLHAASGILEIYAFVKGANAAIWGNVALRALMIFLFTFSFYKLPANFKRAED